LPECTDDDKEFTMLGTVKRKVSAAVVIALAVGGAGGAIAATKLGSPGADTQAVIDDAAKQLGVQPNALTNALKKALENRVDAAVAAGTITKAQGDTMKARIEANGLPFLGAGRLGHGPFGPGFVPRGGDLSTAASYLGLSVSEVMKQARSGQSLAQVATAQGKSAAGLVDALKTAAVKKLDAAVAAGKLTSAQRAQVVSTLTQRLTDLVNRTPRVKTGSRR
jgi:hypothetical protein